MEHPNKRHVIPLNLPTDQSTGYHREGRLSLLEHLHTSGKSLVNRIKIFKIRAITTFEEEMLEHVAAFLRIFRNILISILTELWKVQIRR